MKSKIIQALGVLLLPISFIAVLIVLNIVPFVPLSKYGSGGILLTIIALGLTFVFAKRDGKTFNEIGFSLQKITPIWFATGFLAGLFIAVIMFAIIISLTDLELVFLENANIKTALLWLLAFFPLAYMEEIIFRGYAFTKIYKNLGIWPAQILLAILFTWYHDFTGATFFGQLLGPGVWALIYGITALWTKGIAFPTGLHMALNVVIALVGEKDSRHAIWNLEYANEITPLIESQTNRIGLIMQIAILIIGIVLTEIYRKRSFRRANGVR
ncbi:MAG: lysostaphin resistance A-like protein [Oceanihabitans sp.]